jgi:hypothetical protein
MPMNEIFYHGTQKHCIYSIMMQGFRLDNEMWGRGWGNGVYLSATKEFASNWGRAIIRCGLQRGCRILWHSEYDRKVIDYLKREFGSNIVKPDFWKALPNNKQLKKHEIIAVWNYLIDIHYEGRKRFEKGLLYEFQKNYSRIYEHLKRHQFDGVGSREKDWPEILVFNPSLVSPISVHWWNIDKQDISNPLSQSELKGIQEVAEREWYREQREFEDAMDEYDNEEA